MVDIREWENLANKELNRRGKKIDDLVTQTPEGIAVKPLYTASDLDGLEVTGSLPRYGSLRQGAESHHVRSATPDHSSVCWFFNR